MKIRKRYQQYQRPLFGSWWTDRALPKISTAFTRVTTTWRQTVDRFKDASTYLVSTANNQITGNAIFTKHDTYTHYNFFCITTIIARSHLREFWKYKHRKLKTTIKCTLIYIEIDLCCQLSVDTHPNMKLPRFGVMGNPKTCLTKRKWALKVNVLGYNDNNNNVTFIKRWFQNETNMPYGYLTLAHKRWSDSTCDMPAEINPSLFHGI